MTRAIICGGRDFDDKQYLFDALDKLHLREIAHGGASGADSLAGEWATQRNIPCAVFPADWSIGRSAGPKRNAEMLKSFVPDVVIAFPGGRGTADMIRRAEKKDVLVLKF